MARLQNPFDKVALTVLGELVRYKKRADKSKAVPLGMERVDKRTFDERIAAMSREERQTMLDEKGLAEVGRLTEESNAPI